MRKEYFIIIISIALFTSQLSAQKKTQEHKIKGATGIAIGGATTSLMEVKQMAINNAKVEALKKAGIEEHINSYSDYFRSESNNKMEELFTSDVLSNIRGSVINIEEVSFDKGFTPEGQIKGTVVINCTVIKYKTPKDLTFDIWVDGIKPIYKEGEGLEFDVKPTQDCYTRAFLFSSQDAFIFIPNGVESSFKIPAMTEQSFPTLNPHGEQKVSYELDAGSKNKELNRLVLVFLKQDIPYTGEVAYKQITEWIMTIPPDERVIKSFSFDVYKD